MTAHNSARIDLGHGLEVSRLGFGAMALTHVYGGASSDADALRTLNHAVDVGVTFIDTADVYGEPREGTSGPAGTNEELVAELLRTRRDEVQLATKFGITGEPSHDPGGAPVRGDAAYVRSSAEASLRRLGTDVIDLYYLHRRDVRVPIEETVGAMAELVQQGKVRHLGLSEVTGDELRAASAVHPITAVQSEWSIWSRDVEARVVPAAREVGAGFVPYSPLGRGFLTGALTKAAVAGSMLKGHPRFDAGFDANQRVVDVARARRRGRRDPGAGGPRVADGPGRAAGYAGRADPRDAAPRAGGREPRRPGRPPRRCTARAARRRRRARGGRPQPQPGRGLDLLRPGVSTSNSWSNTCLFPLSRRHRRTASAP